MSRFETDFTAAEDASLSAADELRLRAEQAWAEPARKAAIACYLSAGEGWRDAVQTLGGAFATDAAARLSGGKTE